MARDFADEALHDAERKAQELLGLLTVARDAAQRSGRSATANAVDGLIAAAASLKERLTGAADLLGHETMQQMHEKG